MSQALLDLYQQLRGGDRAASDRFVALASPILLCVIRRRLAAAARRAYDPHDVLQEALIDFLVGLDSHPTALSAGELLGYLRITAANAAKKINRSELDAQKRAAARNVPLVRADAVADKELGPQHTAEEQDEFETFARRLPPHYRPFLFLLREGLSRADAARKLGIDGSTGRRYFGRLSMVRGDPLTSRQG